MSVRSYKPYENKWLIDIRLGRKKRYREVFQGSFEEALVYEEELKRHLTSREKNHTRTIADIAEEYLNHVRIHQSQKTWREKQRIILSHIIRYFGNLSFDLISPKIIDSYKLKRLRELNDKGIKGHRTINIELNVLSNMSKFAFENGYSDKTLEHIKKLPHRYKLPDPLPVEVALKFLDAAKTEPFYYALFLCLYNAGMRKNEVFNLRWDDIMFEYNLIRVVKGKGARKDLFQ